MTLRASAIKTDVLEQYKEEEQNQANVTTKTTTVNNISLYENKVEPNPATVTSTSTSTGTNSLNNISWDQWILIIVFGGGGISAIIFLVTAFIFKYYPFRVTKSKTDGVP